VTNTLSHELEHIRETELTAKDEFSDEYDNHPEFAGGVINILEDQYIDFTRTQRFPGLRSTQAFVVDMLLEDDDQWPPIDNLEKIPEAMLEGLRQVAFAGHAKGIVGADGWLREFLSRVRPHIKRARREKDQQQRKEIAHEVMEIAGEYLPEADFEMPDKCVICGIERPEIIAPLLGPVCRVCVPTGHGKEDGEGNGERIESDRPSAAPTGATGDTQSEQGQFANHENEDCGEPSEPASESAQEQSSSDQSEPLEEDTDVDGVFHPSDGTAAEAKIDELTTMDALAQQQDSSSWWDVPTNVDHRTVGDEDVARYERIQRKIQANRNLKGELRKTRDNARNAGKGVSRDSTEHSSNLEATEDWQRLRDEHRRTFRKLTTRDMSTPSRVGTNLHMDNVVQRTAGDASQDKLFEQNRPVAQGGRVVAVSADMSGSMNGRQVRLALAAIAEATSIVGDDFLATCWTGTDEANGGYLCERDSVGFGLICGGDEPFQWDQLDPFVCNGGTPTADGIDLTSELLRDAHAREKLMIVITDGDPNVEYAGKTDAVTDSPTQDARQIVHTVRSENIKVIGLYVGGAVENSSMDAIFGANGFVSASMDDLAPKLIEIYRRQLRV
jgi:hypothetical protein